MDQETTSLLASGGDEISHSARVVNEKFLSEQKIYQTWDKPAMEAATNSASKQVQGFHRVAADAIKILEESMAEAKKVDDDQTLSVQGKWDGRQKINAATSLALNKDLNKRIEGVDDEIERLEKTIKFHYVSTGDIGADESRMSEIRNYYRDDEMPERDLLFHKACGAGDQWIIRSMLESPIPMISKEAKERGMSIRRHREDPSRSYSLAIHKSLKRQLELMQHRINKSLLKRGYSQNENDPLVVKARNEYFGQAAYNKRLAKQRAVRRAESRAEHFGGTR